MNEHKTKGLFPAEGMIKQFREQHGWLQKEFAAKAGLDVRTLQRAESAKTRIQRGALQSIAAQLGMSLADIVVKTDASSEPRKPSHENVRLFATQSADEICKLFSDVVDVDYKLEADPTRQQAEKVARSMEIMAALKDCATYEEWMDPGELKVPLPDQIRMRGELNDLLKELAVDNVRFFIGQYVFRYNYPDSKEYQGGTVRLIEIEKRPKGAVVVSTEETRTIHRQYFGLSETEQIAEIRKHLDRGGRILRWPLSKAFLEFRAQYEAEKGKEVWVWSEQAKDEVPF